MRAVGRCGGVGIRGDPEGAIVRMWGLRADF